MGIEGNRGVGEGRSTERERGGIQEGRERR
jgi:hypothetical protein